MFSELQKCENTSYPVNLVLVWIIWILYCIRFLLTAFSFILWGRVSGCASGLTASQLFYSPDLERDRMRCHHGEQRASRRHIPRKPYTHVIRAARSAAAHNGGSTSTRTINATALHPLRLTSMKVSSKWMSEVKPRCSPSAPPLRSLIWINTCRVSRLETACHINTWQRRCCTCLKETPDCDCRCRACRPTCCMSLHLIIMRSGPHQTSTQDQTKHHSVTQLKQVTVTAEWCTGFYTKTAPIRHKDQNIL